MKLIFNADDFGYCKGINLGIVEACQNGPVRSATIMANKPGFYHAVGLAHQNPGLRVGVHLTLSSGRSVGGPYKTLTDCEGHFPGYAEVESKARSGELDLSEVGAEYEAQIRKVIAAGITPDHFDGHHHLQNLPGVADVFLRLAKQYGAAVRFFDRSLLAGEYAGIKTTAAFEGGFYGDAVSPEGLKEVLSSRRGADSLEVMCHPGFVDRALYEGSVYSLQRVSELDILTSRETQDFIRESGWTVCSFSDL
ncbi:MAG: chitin disaccharide deacetylase [Oscillospiraceae bacterium]|nr:chitin disaccharide deacetylase [Oscillospiraceae bacterium]